jgi:uncharacterized protein with HEPN domain
VIHWVQTIGEAANAVSQETQRYYPDIPWRQVVDMRNLLAHGYRFEDPAIVWQVVIGTFVFSRRKSVVCSRTSQTQRDGIVDVLAHKTTNHTPVPV